MLLVGGKSIQMLCKIADLITEVPEAGGLASRCEEYFFSGEKRADVIIRPELYRKKHYRVELSENNLAYMESAYQFYVELVRFGGIYLHSSAVSLDNKAYLFSGPSGMGKSTHTKLWQATFGGAAQVFNDDKPAMRRLNGVWYAYGTPWCGKDGINQNRKVPLAGICFLKQASENRIRCLTQQEAMKKILTQTIFRFQEVELLDQMLETLDKLVREIPVFELENRPEPEAAHLSYETMRRAAEELGL